MAKTMGASDWLSKAQANRGILKKMAWSFTLMASLYSTPSHPIPSCRITRANFVNKCITTNRTDG